MIIDLHTHVWTNPAQLGSEMADVLRKQSTRKWPQFDASPCAHDEAMKSSNKCAVCQFMDAWHTACFIGVPCYSSANPGGREQTVMTSNPSEKYELPHFLTRGRIPVRRLKISS